MNLEKQDFLRNAVPGYIYFLVILSFYLITGQLNVLLEDLGILTCTGKFTELAPILGLVVSGFPVGFIIQSIYRVWHSRSDHREMENIEADILKEQFSQEPKILERIPGTPERVFPSDRPGRRYSWFLELFLMEKGDKEVRNRLQILMWWIHSLGGAIVAILAAIFTLGMSFILEHCCYPCGIVIIDCARFIFLIFWFLICLTFWYVREDTKNIFHVLWRHFVYVNRGGIKEFINKENSPTKEKEDE